MEYRSRIERYLCRLWLVMVSSWVPSASTAYSQPVDFSSYNELQAAYIYNIAKFVEWPGLAQGQDVQLCVIDEDQALFEILQNKISNKTVNKRHISVVYMARSKLKSGIDKLCNLVYLNSEINPDLIQGMLESNKGLHPVLWVSSPKIEAVKGALIELTLEKQRIVIYVNKKEIGRAAFTIRSPLLSVARLR